MFQMDLTSRASVHLAELRRLGYDVLASDDFEQIEALMQKIGSPYRTPMFDVRRNDFNKGGAFWLFLMRRGVPVGGVAARAITLGSESFLDYMQRVSAAQFDMAQPLAGMAAPLTRRLQGRLVHFGALHMPEEIMENAAVMRSFCHMAVVLAAMSWPEFDWMFAFAPEAHGSLQAAFGFPIVTPYALNWHEPVPFSHANSEAVVYLSKLDLTHLLSLSATRPKDAT